MASASELGRATVAFEVKDEASGAANHMAGALENLKGVIEDDTAELKAMQSALRNMRGNSAVTMEATKSLTRRIDEQKLIVAKSQARFIEFGGSFRKVTTSTKDATAATKLNVTQLGNLTALASRVAPELSGMAGEAAGLAKMLGSAGVAGAVLAAAAAFVVVVGAIGYAVGKMAMFVLTTADALRTQKQLYQGIAMSARMGETLYTTLMRGPGGLPKQFDPAAGDALLSMANRIQEKYAVSSEEVQGLVSQLHKARFSGNQMEGVLEAAAMIQSIPGQGKAVADEFVNIASQYRMMGKDIRGVVSSAKLQFGDMAKAVKLGFGEQMKSLHANIAKMFSGVDIGPFLGELNNVLKIFSSTHVAGKAIKSIVNSIFQPMANSAKTVGPIIKEFFMGMIIAALLVAITFHKVRIAIKKAFGLDNYESINMVNIALYAGIAAGITLIATIAVLGVVFAGVALSIAFALAFVLAPFAAIGLAIYGIIVAVMWLYDQFKWVIDQVGTMGWEDAGLMITNGLVNGIKAGAGAVWDAIKDVGKGIMKWFSKGLDIKSPSGVFKKYGFFITAGAATGIRAGYGEVKDSMRGMTDIMTARTAYSAGSTAGVGGEGMGPSMGPSLNFSMPEPSAAPPPPPSSGGASARPPVYITLNITGGGKDNKALATEIIHELEAAFESELIVMGAAPIEAQ